MYRTHKMRRGINIYKQLPPDLQHKILHYWQLPDLIKKHHYDVINRILYNRLTQNRILTNRYSELYINKYTADCASLVKLMIKYCNTLDNNTHMQIINNLQDWEIGLLNQRFTIMDNIDTAIYHNFISNLIMFINKLIEVSYYNNMLLMNYYYYLKHEHSILHLL